MPSPAARLRELIIRPEGLLLPGAANALTARIIEDVGFDAVYLTGAGVKNLTERFDHRNVRARGRYLRRCRAAADCGR